MEAWATFRPPDEDAADLGLALELGVAGEDGLAGGQQLLERAEVRVRALLALGVGLGALALFEHELAELGLVDFQPGLFGHFQGEVDREAVGVVQGKGVGAGERLVGGLGLLDGVLEAGGAGGDGAQERLLFGVGNPADAVEVGLDDRVDALHGVARGGQQLGQAGLFDAEQAHGADGPADQAAQHVAAALVGGGHAVGDQHEGRADVVGNDAHPDVVRVVRVLGGLRGGVLPAGEGRGPVDHGADLVRLVHVLDVLEDHREALHAQARVDVLLGQLAGDVEVHLGADVVDLVLHEHEVPDLDVAVFVGDGAALDAVGRAAVVVDLRAGTGGAGLAGGPVVVGLAHALDPLGRHAGVLQPQLLGLVVLFVDGDPEPLRRQSVPAVVHAAWSGAPRRT